MSTATSTVSNIRDTLLKAYIDKAEAEATVAKSNEAIVALRNVLAGIPLGQQIAAEIAAEAKSATPGDIAPTP